MSGFAPEWLTLREDTDHRARNAGLLAALGKHFSTRDAVTVVDLGAGLGSNLRATAPVLPARQHWVLVDHDPVLLAGACDAIASWADSVRPATAGLEVMKADRSIRVEVRHADLARDPGAFAAHAPDLVTAAALFDLVSEEWIGRFTAALAAARVPLYAVLGYDGTNAWSPPHPVDAAMVAAFNRHQGSDKGFGIAAGSKATDFLAERLKASHRNERGQSPWILGSGETKLIRALTQGFAEAVRETGEVAAANIEAWLKARMADGVSCTVGHEDILAIAR